MRKQIYCKLFQPGFRFLASACLRYVRTISFVIAVVKTFYLKTFKRLNSFAIFLKWFVFFFNFDIPPFTKVHCLSKGNLSQQQVRHQDHTEYIFRLLGRHHQLLFKQKYISVHEKENLLKLGTKTKSQVSTKACFWNPFFILVFISGNLAQIMNWHECSLDQRTFMSVMFTICLCLVLEMYWLFWISMQRYYLKYLRI